jgi:hypothetical protein
MPNTHKLPWHLLVVAPAALLPATLATGCTATATVTGSQATSSCSANAALSCTAGASGYSCTGVAEPADTNAALECSIGVVDGANTDYCCFTFAGTTTCARDATVTGCQAGSYGFSCTGGDTPEQADTSLACSDGTPGNAGSTLYCCSLGGGTAATCAADSSVACEAGASGYSCTGSDTPAQSDGSLVCSTGTAGSGDTRYCCVAWTSASCGQDASVQGCAYPSVGFACSGSSSPSQIDTSLTCSDPTAGANGETLYCCQ